MTASEKDFNTDTETFTVEHESGTPDVIDDNSFTLIDEITPQSVNVVSELEESDVSVDDQATVHERDNQEVEFEELFQDLQDVDLVSTVPDLFLPGKFSQSLTRPQPGSVIHRASTHGMSQAELEGWLAKTWFRNLAIVIFDPEVDTWNYVVSSLSQSHTAAIDIGEYAYRLQQQYGVNSFQVLSKLTQRNITNSSDVASLLRIVLRRMPHLLDFVTKYTVAK